MKLFAIRHTDAGEPIPGDPKADDARMLTEEGVAAAEKLAEYLKANDLVPYQVVASPTVRTKQTAAILRRKLGLPPVRVEDGLGPMRHRGDGALAEVVKKIAADQTNKRVAIVANHDSLAGGLRALNGLDAQEFAPFAKGEVRLLDVDRDEGCWEELERCLPSDMGLEDLY